MGSLSATIIPGFHGLTECKCIMLNNKLIFFFKKADSC